MSNTKAWGKYKGAKPIALFYNGLVVSSCYEPFECSDIMGTSAIERALKAKTGLNHVVIPVDEYGNFEANDWDLPKVISLLERI